MFLCRFSSVLAGLVLVWSSSVAHAQISKGNQILINRGLQLQAIASSDCYVHRSTYFNANYSTFDWFYPSRPENDPDGLWMGPAPGMPWARWAGDQSQMPPVVTPYGDEAPYMSQLVALQLGDEWALNDTTTRNNLVNWFIAVSNSFPNVILYHNNYGSQVDNASLADFYNRAHPDALCFDSYPWQSAYDVNQPNHIGPAIAATPLGWYGDMVRYRAHARGANIPLGVYRQTFHAVQEYDTPVVFRDPSPSELRLNTSAALAFNAKILIDFDYNPGAASLFTIQCNGCGDSVPNALYYEQADANLRAKNLGPALVRLTSIYDLHNPNDANPPPGPASGLTFFPPGTVTSLLFLRGQKVNGGATNYNGIPIGLQPAPSGAPDYSWWEFGKNDPYLTSWSVTNKAGVKNSGLPGDVIVSWFQVLDESLDGPTYSNEVYMMVVNGLIDPTGTAADCQQEIKLNFSNAFLAVEMLNPTNGQVQVQSLPLTNGFRQLVLDLNGGDAALFKFSDGAPFVGATVVGPPVITRQPVGQSNTAGATVTFTALAAGALPLNYQWQFNGANISGATTNSYALANVQGGNVGSYTLVVTNASGNVTSLVATLTVQFSPQISTQPQSQTVGSGANPSFNVAASGNPAPTYQWRLNGTNISGATTSSYTRANVQSSDTGSYSVLLSNSIGTTTSADAVLVVNGAPSITAQPQSRAVLVGSTANFNVTAVGSGTLSYRWKKNNSNLADGGSISGAATAALTLGNVQASDVATYTVAVSNAFGGNISAGAALAIATQPIIQIQPQSRTNNGGTMATFIVVGSGNGLTYQWRRNGTNMVEIGTVTGSTADTLTINPVVKTDIASYTVVVSNAAGSATSSIATLTVLFPFTWSEPFNYPASSNLAGLISPNGLPWADVGTNVAGPVVTINAGNLTVTNLAPAQGNSILFGGNGKSARLSVPAFTSGTVYFSFAFKVLDLTGASSSGGFFAGFNNSIGSQGNQPTVIGTRVYLRTVTGGFNLGLSKSSDTELAWDSTVYNTNQTIFLVGSYTLNSANNTDDVSKLWINPNPTNFGAANLPPYTLTEVNGNDISGNQIASFIFFQRSTTLEPAAMIADELRIDTNWAGVTPPVPIHMDNAGFRPDGRFRLQGTGGAGHISIDTTTNLLNWSESANTLGTNGTFEYVDPLPNPFRRFYRGRFVP